LGGSENGCVLEQVKQLLRKKKEGIYTPSPKNLTVEAALRPLIPA
jgi:hypothetical protein